MKREMGYSGLVLKKAQENMSHTRKTGYIATKETANK